MEELQPGEEGGVSWGVRCECEDSPSNLSYLKGSHRKEELHRFWETPNKNKAQEGKSVWKILVREKGEFSVNWTLPKYRLACHWTMRPWLLAERPLGKRVLEPGLADLFLRAVSVPGLSVKRFMSTKHVHKTLAQAVNKMLVLAKPENKCAVLYFKTTIRQEKQALKKRNTWL